MSLEIPTRVSPARAVKLLAIVAVALCTGAGCAQKGAGEMPGLIPVKGKVIYKGQPLTKGVVRFEPDYFGRPAQGELQSDGTFSLSTLTKGDGVVAGHHKVSIGGIDLKLRRDKNFQKKAATLQADVSPENTDFTFEIQ
jgi:hypothetical protein